MKLPSSSAVAPSTAKYVTSFAPSSNPSVSDRLAVAAMSEQSLVLQPEPSSGICTSVRSAPLVLVSTAPYWSSCGATNA